MSILSSTHSGKHKIIYDKAKDMGLNPSMVHINDDMSIDYAGNMYVQSFVHNGKIELPFKLNYVGGIFSCSNCGLTTLEGCPDKVRAFYCQDNKLTSLKGGPRIIACIAHECSNNKIITLEWCPQTLDGTYVCSNNPLTSLQGLPKHFVTLICCDNPTISDFTCDSEFRRAVLHDTNYYVWVDKHPDKALKCTEIEWGPWGPF